MHEPEPLSIRPLVAADALPYKAVMLHAYRHAADAFTSTPEEREAESDDWWVNRIAHPLGLQVAFGAFDGRTRQLAGVVATEYAAKTKTRHKGLVVGMYVMPPWRGQGLARRLMHAAIDHAAARGAAVLQLEYTEGNAPAEALYRSLGFQPFGIEPMGLLTPGGYRAKVYMWLGLAPGAGRSGDAPA